VPDWINWRYLKLVDLNGQLVGTIDAVWPEEGTERFTWGVVRTPLGHRPAYLPDAKVIEGGKAIALPYSGETIRAAPAIDLNRNLDRAVARRVARYYMVAKPPGPGTGRPRPRPPKRPPGSASAGAGEDKGMLV
jgi:hypothetical protein